MTSRPGRAQRSLEGCEGIRAEPQHLVIEGRVVERTRSDGSREPLHVGVDGIGIMRGPDGAFYVAATQLPLAQALAWPGFKAVLPFKGFRFYPRRERQARDRPGTP